MVHTSPNLLAHLSNVWCVLHLWQGWFTKECWLGFSPPIILRTFGGNTPHPTAINKASKWDIDPKTWHIPVDTYIFDMLKCTNNGFNCGLSEFPRLGPRSMPHLFCIGYWVQLNSIYTPDKITLTTLCIMRRHAMMYKEVSKTFIILIKGLR